MWKYLHKYASPPYFYAWAGRMIPWVGALTALCLLYGAWGGLVMAPIDEEMGNGFRIIYVHVPAAWMSLFIYVTMAIYAGIGYIWRIKLAHAVAAASAPIGASFTALALATGSIWGRPMWGTWWEWDPRLTSELVLLFLYFGVMALRASFDDVNRADRASALLAIVGVINVPIIHFSVQWWNSLHQGPTVSKIGKPEIATSMLVPLLVMTVGFMLYYATVLLMRMRAEVLERERNTRWVKEFINEPAAS